MTDDPGVKDMLKFNLACDTLHQNRWLQATEELQPDGLHKFAYLPGPEPFGEAVLPRRPTRRYTSSPASGMRGIVGLARP